MWLSTANILQLNTSGFEFMRIFTDKKLSDIEEYDLGRGGVSLHPWKAQNTKLWFIFLSPQCFWTVSTGTIIRKFSHGWSHLKRFDGISAVLIAYIQIDLWDALLGCFFSQILLIFFNRLCPCDKCMCIVGVHSPTYRSGWMSQKPPMISTEDSLDARSMATMRTVQDMSGSQDFNLR